MRVMPWPAKVEEQVRDMGQRIVPYFSHLANHDELVPLLVVPELAVPRLVVPPVGGISSTILLSDTHE